MLKSAWEKSGHLVIVGLTVFLLYSVGSGNWGGTLATRWHWIIGIMAGFIMLLGTTTNGRLDGALIDWRNKMSLAHLQVILWTILGMSAFLTISFERISHMASFQYDPDKAFEQAKAVGEVECLKNVAEKDVTEEKLKSCPEPDALQIIFPEELLLAMGISLASFAGSAFVKTNQSNTTLISTDEEKKIQDTIREENRRKEDATRKADTISQEIASLQSRLELAKKVGDNDDIESLNTSIEAKNKELLEQKQIGEKASSKVTEKEQELTKFRDAQEQAKGLLHVRKDPKEAEWGDIFKKELVGESNLIDLSKLQMFFFTITVIFAYAATLNQLMRDTELVMNPFGVALPAFSSSLVVLLGISHGGYLAIKNSAGTATEKK